MGMFDYIKCEIALPGIPEGTLFQTKDTQEWCEMKTFTIRRDGTLVKHDYDTERTPEDELPYKDDPPDSIRRFFASLRTVAGSERDVMVDFDGDLVFYTDVGEDVGYVDFRATFRKGRLREIYRLEAGRGDWEPVYVA